MEEGIDAGVQVDEIDFCHVAWFLQAPGWKTAKNIKEVVKVLFPRLRDHGKHGYQHQDAGGEDTKFYSKGVGSFRFTPIKVCNP